MLEEEQRLIEAARAGDGESFGALYQHYVSPIYRFIYMKVSHREEAEDLTHEVFMKAWQHLPGYTNRGFPFSSWLYQIARNRVVDHYRLKRVHTPLDGGAPTVVQLATTNDLDFNLDANLDLTKIMRALTVLTADQQDVILLKFMNDLSHREIAGVLERSEGAVRLMQHRAIVKLRKVLRDTENQL